MPLRFCRRGILSALFVSNVPPRYLSREREREREGREGEREREREGEKVLSFRWTVANRILADALAEKIADEIKKDAKA